MEIHSLKCVDLICDNTYIHTRFSYLLLKFELSQLNMARKLQTRRFYDNNEVEDLVMYLIK